MREKPSIKFEIPVPWASAPACIEANGCHAVIVAGIIAAIAIFIFAIR